MSRILAVGSKESLSRLDKVDGGLILLQMIRFEPVKAALPDSPFDWVFFGSRRGIRFFLDTVPERFLTGARFGCVGEKTADALRRRGHDVEFVPSRYSSTYWPKEFVEKFPDAERILFPTSDRSSFVAPDIFQEKGISFKKLVVYRTVCAETGKMDDNFSGAVFASPSCFSCFTEKWGVDVLRGKVLVAIGDVTAKAISAAGLFCSIPERFTMADAIRHCRKKLEDL